jgi:hypothetical protein
LKGLQDWHTLPNSIEEALALNKENGNTLWYNDTMKEMENFRIAFELQPNMANSPGYKPVQLFLIFDVKMTSHVKHASTLTYSSVVSRKSVRIDFLIAALNELQLTMCDVVNAYLNAPTT